MTPYIINKAPLNTTATLINSKTRFSPNWQSIKPLTVNQYPWYKHGRKQDTQIKITANSETLFIQIIALDNYSYAKQTELNHMLICEDSCVEFFFSPSGLLGSSYVNLEVNCTGTLHIAYGPDRNNRQFISQTAASLIECNSSLNIDMNKPIKLENADDTQWCIEIALPFAVIAQLTGEPINKNKWYGNFYRCGGRIEPQYAVWNNIDVIEPDYHQPECFGELIFDL